MKDWDDILLFNEQLSDEERMVQSSIHDYCQKELMPRILDDNRNEKFYPDMYRQLGELGFLGATIKGYGCAGINYVSYGLITRELERVDTSYRSGFSVQSSLSMYAIYSFGSECEVNTMIAPVKTMVGDTLKVTAWYVDFYQEITEKSINIILE